MIEIARIPMQSAVDLVYIYALRDHAKLVNEFMHKSKFKPLSLVILKVKLNK